MCTPRILLCSIVLCVTACGGGASQPAAPTSLLEIPPAQNQPRGAFTIRGTVSERLPGGGLQPMPGVSVNAWIAFDRMGYSYMYVNGARFSQANGEYVLTNVPDGARVQVEVYKDGYVQQCAATQVMMSSDATIDTQLVSRGNLSASLDWVTPMPGLRFITGTIYENTPMGKAHVAGAWVSYEPTVEVPAAATFSDSAGRYLLCGILEEQPAEVGAWVNQRNVYVTAPPRVTSIDLLVP